MILCVYMAMIFLDNIQVVFNNDHINHFDGKIDYSVTSSLASEWLLFLFLLLRVSKDPILNRFSKDKQTYDNK